MASIAVSKYKFLQEPSDSLKCIICLDVAENPWQHDGCGKLLCKDCLDQCRGNQCPYCREENPQYFEDRRGRREINELGVRCSNVERDCGWEGTVDTLVNHMATCEFTLLDCSNNCKDHDGKIMQFMRKDLEEHLRNSCPNRRYTCKYCKKVEKYFIITGNHDKKCPKKPIPCTNEDCQMKIERRGLKRHREEECLYTGLSCKFSNLGCVAKKMRKDMAAHEGDDSSHLHMAIETVAELQKEKTQLQERVEQLDKSSTKLKLSDFNETVMDDDTFTSPEFYSSPGGYCMALNMKKNEEDVLDIFVSIKSGCNDYDLEWPLVGTVTVTLLNQLENKDHFTKALKLEQRMNARVDSSYGVHFISLAALHCDPDRNKQYLKDDSLFFKVSVNVPGHRHWLECTV